MKSQHTSAAQNIGPTAKFTAIIVVVLPAVIALLLAIYVLVADQVLPYRETKLLPEGTRIEDVDKLLKGLSDSDRAQLMKELRADIAARPFHSQTIKNLAALYQTGKTASEGDPIVIVAANQVRRDFALQSNALRIELEQKKYDDAIRRLDIIYLTEPKSQNDVLKTLAGFVSSTARDALINAIAKKPVWRNAFLISLSGDTSVKSDAIYGLFSSLRKAGSPPSQNEVRVFLQRLISEGAYSKAYFVWLDSIDIPELRKVGLINDGGFDTPPSNMFFTWTLYETKNVDARVVSRSLESTDKAFRIAFQPARTNYNGLIQYLQLSPGSYSFTGEAKTDNLETPVGLVWRINCVSNLGETLSETKPFSGSMPWTVFATEFEVPQENCMTQILRLQNNAKTDLDMQISGQAQFDNLLIKRVEK
jgi:hypothetical protein